MIILLHGDNTLRSRQALVTQKQQFSKHEVRFIDGASINTTTLTQALDSVSLFGINVVVIIEDMFSKQAKNKKLLDELCSKIKNADTELPIVIWESKLLTKAQTNMLGKVNEQIFKIPTVIFSFLDAIRPGNKACVSILDQSLENDAPELVFSLLVTRLRMLIMLKDNVTPSSLAQWQQDRLTAQAKFFTMDQLLKIHKKLLQMDISIKSGKTAYGLKSLLRQYIVDL